MRFSYIGKRLAAFGLAFALAACGGGGDDSLDDRHAPAGREAGDPTAPADGEPRGAGKPAADAAVAGVSLVADAGVRSVTLSWSSNGASRYNVYLSSSPGCDIARYSLCPDGRMLPNVLSPYKVSGLANGRAWYAKVESVQASGSSVSNEAAARPNSLAFDRSVAAIAPAADGSTYLGGDFSRVGIRSGQGVTLDAASGRQQFPGFPIVGPGSLDAALPDGAGGWFIGGTFRLVGGAPKPYLARIRADGSVDPNWNPLPDNGVSSLALMNGVLYIGGNFGRINGQERVGLAAVDAATGRLQAWNPNANQGTTALVAANGRVYAGGYFSYVGAFSRSHLAAIDVYGNVLPWNPGADKLVRSLAISGSTVYAGGGFDVIGNTARPRLAAIDAASGAVSGWNAGVSGCPSCDVHSIAVAGSTVYIGGSFRYVGRTVRNGVAAIDGAGAVLPWNPAASADGARVLSLAVGQDAAGKRVVYAGGDFATMGGASRLNLAAIDAAGAALPWNPSANAAVNRVAVSGTTVVAGGTFTALGSTVRNALAAIDASGALKPWKPNANGSVVALAIAGDQIVAGGRFTAIGDQPRERLARIDLAGKPSDWNPGANGVVRALAQGASKLYVGGDFTSAGGDSRMRLAAFGTAGELLAWNPTADHEVHALAVAAEAAPGAGETVYVGGRFASVGYHPRKRIAQIDQYGLATQWDPWGNRDAGAQETVKALVYANAAIYVGGGFAARFGRNLGQIGENGTVVPFYGTDLPVHSLMLSGRLLRVGGEFEQVFSATTPVQRNRLAAIDIVDRTVTAWNPNVADGMVQAIAPGPGGAIQVGGLFSSIGNRVEGGFATLAP